MDSDTGSRDDNDCSPTDDAVLGRDRSVDKDEVEGVRFVVKAKWAAQSKSLHQISGANRNSQVNKSSTWIFWTS
jgi:hypothetical protein